MSGLVGRALALRWPPEPSPRLTQCWWFLLGSAVEQPRVLRVFPAPISNSPRKHRLQTTHRFTENTQELNRGKRWSWKAVFLSLLNFQQWILFSHQRNYSLSTSFLQARQILGKSCNNVGYDLKYDFLELLMLAFVKPPRGGSCLPRRPCARFLQNVCVCGSIVYLTCLRFSKIV